MTAAVSPQPALRAAGFVSYRILIGRRNAVGHHVSMVAAMFAVTVAVRTIVDAVKLKEAV